MRMCPRLQLMRGWRMSTRLESLLHAAVALKGWRVRSCWCCSNVHKAAADEEVEDED